MDLAYSRNEFNTWDCNTFYIHIQVIYMISIYCRFDMKLFKRRCVSIYVMYVKMNKHLSLIINLFRLPNLN